MKFAITDRLDGIWRSAFSPFLYFRGGKYDRQGGLEAVDHQGKHG